jgi:hypothetical protein
MHAYDCLLSEFFGYSRSFNMRTVLAFVICLLHAWTPAAAADVSAFQRGILIQGQIQPGDYAKIVRFVRHPDNYERFARAVFLDSGGGDLVETIKIANLLEKSYAATHVLPGARCYSACFILWMGGVSRNIANGATLGVHQIHVKVDGDAMDPASERFASIARRVETYLAGMGTPRTILDRMNATAPADMFVISQRWLAEQQLLAPLSYRMGFASEAQAHCGPEPYAAAVRDRTPVDEENARRWTSQLRRWIGCADEIRARIQQTDSVRIAALMATD